jgi:hypothetical protein
MILNKRIFIIFSFFILSGCFSPTTYEKFTAPSGKEGYFIINCDLSGRPSCYQLSGQLCPNGYNNLNPVGRVVDTFDRYIECK